MPTLIERLDIQVAALQAERERIKTQAATDLAAVNTKLAELVKARAAITADVEQAYAALRTLKLIQEI